MNARKFPEAPPEAHPEGSGGDWIKIAEAADLIGMSERAARDWVKRYSIPQRGERPALVSEAAVRKQLAALGKAPEDVPDVPGSSSEPIDVSFRVNDGTDRVLVPLDRMLEQVQGLSEQLTILSSRNEALALEVGGLRERTITQEQTIDRLMTERDALQQRVDELSAPPPPATPSVAHREQERPWWRFWEAWA